jgi:hypothetical protein
VWKLKKISTDETLSGPAPLPENWGPIFGLSGITDRLQDLSWLGDKYSDMGWFELTEEEIALFTAQQLLEECEGILENDTLTVEQKSKWISYIHALENAKTLAGFPSKVVWPVKPE